MGDPAGIGPEIVVKALSDGSGVRDRCRPLVIGSAAVLRDAASRWAPGATIIARASIEEVDEKSDRPGTIEVIDVAASSRDDVDQSLPVPGVVSARCGALAVASVRTAAALARGDHVDGIATAPLNKEAMHAAGFRYPGHTELLAEEFGVERFSLALGAEGLYLLHVTTHVALRTACELITTERVLATIVLAQELASALGRDDDEIAVLGLNPHAGENGLFGSEDASAIAPAVALARGQGIAAVGPLPADAALPLAFRGRYRLVIAMYHDQGHVAFKSLFGDRGVNVTVGLPTVRTSVDHGTAFDIAGRGIARHASMVHAIDMAAQLAPAWRARWRPAA
jgi:4-hydroxythreonine-4-phosphate dehydrogenase